MQTVHGVPHIGQTQRSSVFISNTCTAEYYQLHLQPQHPKRSSKSPLQEMDGIKALGLRSDDQKIVQIFPGKAIFICQWALLVHLFHVRLPKKVMRTFTVGNG
jgi:hypothetical protein